MDLLNGLVYCFYLYLYGCCIAISSLCNCTVTATTHTVYPYKSRMLLSKGLQQEVTPPDPGPKYKVHYYTQRLDHFNQSDARTFQQRYLVVDDQWDKQGPILLYTGNEGDITWFCNNTGFMFDFSSRCNGLVIFIEHRYYGESLPFGQTSYKDKEHLAYLTSEQALADFAVLITEIKETIFSTTSPVIAVGGSYGGMLAAWMRMKYPDVVIGALAASAPVWWFTDLTPCNSAYVTITRDFEQATPDWPHSTACSDTIRRSWGVVDNIAHEDGGVLWLSRTFRLCQDLGNEKAVSNLLGWMEETWFNLAMADYPVPASFLEPLPAWPINETCKFLSQPLNSDKALVEAVASAIGVYYNYTGKVKCYELDSEATPSLGIQGWNYQACTEMVMPMCSDGVNDMFRSQPWNFTAYEEGCKSQYGVTPQPHLIERLYGGKNISSHSNIVFSNGLLDPWHGGGVLSNISDSLIAIVIPKGAHHLDLRHATSNDPGDITLVRRHEMDVILSWIKQ